MKLKFSALVIAGAMVLSSAGSALAATVPYFTFSTNTNLANVGGSQLFSATFLAGSNGTLTLDTAAGEAPTYGGSTVTVNSFSGSSSGNDISTLSLQFTYNGTTYILSNNVAGISMDLTPGTGNNVSVYSKSGTTYKGGTSTATLAYYGAAPEIDGGLIPYSLFIFGTVVIFVMRRASRPGAAETTRALVAA